MENSIIVLPTEMIDTSERMVTRPPLIPWKNYAGVPAICFASNVKLTPHRNKQFHKLGKDNIRARLEIFFPEVKDSW